eukprot:5739797-Prymnesium_polylepis.1
MPSSVSNSSPLVSLSSRPTAETRRPVPPFWPDGKSPSCRCSIRMIQSLSVRRRPPAPAVGALPCSIVSPRGLWNA